MSRVVWLAYAAVLYTFILFGLLVAMWLVGEKLRRLRATSKARRDFEAMRNGWTTDDDRKVAALLRDDW